MLEIKDMGEAFIAKLREIAGSDTSFVASRDLTLAEIHAEDAVMRAVRYITK